MALPKIAVCYKRFPMTTRASYGMTVKVKDTQSGEMETFFLVPVPEENWQEAKVSMYHPIGKALFSKEVGHVVDIASENGSHRQLEILEIEPT